MPVATYLLDQRARVLTNPSQYLPAADTRTLTGHTPPTLTRLVDEGKLIARRVGARSFSYQTSSVLAYCRQQDPPFTLFDALATTTGGVHLTETELETELGRTGSGARWTMVRRDHAPPDWPSWKHWYQGHTHQAHTVLFEQRTAWAQQNRQHRARGIVHRTLWLPSQPLGSFGQYSLARYEHLTAAGGAVRVLPAWKMALLEDQRILPDLEVTPEAVYVRCHSRVGSRDGAVRINDPELVASTAAFLGWANRQHALSLTDFAQWHRQGAA
ncbi:DUF6879 family protein [Nocardiopsis terrae]